MEDVVHYDLDLYNGGGRNELEEPQSANAGKHPLSKIKSTMNSNSLVRFSLYEVPLCADIAGAYHCILVDHQTSLLRLFMWFHDLDKLQRERVFKQQTQAF